MNDNTVEFEGVMRNGMLWKRVDGDWIVDGFAPDGDYHVTLRRSELKLKPCPFCGGNRLFLSSPVTTRKQEWDVHCLGCSLKSPKHDTRTAAIAAWNRRA